MGIVKRRIAIFAIAGLVAMLTFLCAGQQAWAGNTYTLNPEGYAPQYDDYDYDDYYDDYGPDYSYYEGDLTISNGETIDEDIYCTGNFTMLPGSKVNGAVHCNGNFTMSGGVITKGKGEYAVECDGNFIKTGGTITKTGGGSYGISCRGYFKHTSGYITINNADTAIMMGSYGSHKAYTMQVLGGCITCNSPSNRGLDLNNANMLMKGGTLKVNNSYGEGICVYRETYRGKSYGGKVTVTGGLLYSTVRKPGSYNAIYADSMTNKVGCLRSIKGGLPYGASFKSGGNEFKVRDYDSIAITKYGAASKYPAFNSWKFGGVRYYVRGIGPKAFSTKRGQQVKYIRFKQDVNYIGANAFYGTKNLTNLRFDYLPLDYKYNRNGDLKSVWYYKGTPIAKNAFAKCGKSNGKKLTVTLEYGYGVYKPEASKYRKLFTYKGMPKGFKLKTHW